MRVPIPDAVKVEVLYSHDRRCCVCSEPGRPVQIHHIDDDPSNNALGNLAALCLICHNETQVTGGFGRKLDAVTVTRYRDEWLARVALRREKADSVDHRAAAPDPRPTVPDPWDEPPKLPSRLGLLEYVLSLPAVRRLAYEEARPGWDLSTREMVEARYQVTEVLVGALERLASYYPVGHFDGKEPRDYFSEVVADRHRWHLLCSSTGGEWHSGSIVGIAAAQGVLSEVERLVVDLVAGLTWGDMCEERFDFNAWSEAWRKEP